MKYSEDPDKGSFPLYNNPSISYFYLYIRFPRIIDALTTVSFLELRLFTWRVAPITSAFADATYQLSYVTNFF
jgi:hypothetical protein